MPKPKSPALECDDPCALLIKTRELLLQDKRSTLKIATESGIPFYWLLEFQTKRTAGGSVNRVVFLYEYLSGRKLKL